MSIKRLLFVFFIMATGFIVSLSSQNYVHASLSFQGRVLENGAILTAGQTINMTLRVYDDEFGGDLLFEEKQEITTGEEKFLYTFDKGIVTVRKNAADITTDNLWAEVESNNQVMIPRLSLAKIGTSKNLTGDTLGIREAVLFSSGAATVVIDNSGVTLGGLLDMGTQSISLGSVTRATWPSSTNSSDPLNFSDIEGIAAESQITELITRDTELSSGLAGKADSVHTHGTLYYSKTYVDALESRIAALENLLKHFSRDGDEVTLSGANLNIVDGSGDTDGAVNGKGNLVIGYNESRGSTDDRTGSHNLVVGGQHNFSSYGCLIAGFENDVSAKYACVSGGHFNYVTGNYASISGGYNNIADGNYASISGGSVNSAYGIYSSVSGGSGNNANGAKSAISGGINNVTSGDYSSISGGSSGYASGQYSSVSGGDDNTASGVYSSVYGGENQTAGSAHAYKP
ncbi:MAG: hypothetical protein U9Q58_09400 [Pseudomonadota bacterium]|nr:hypothetical protein [Pseudomonadota bacterium]